MKIEKIFRYIWSLYCGRIERKSYIFGLFLLVFVYAIILLGALIISAIFEILPQKLTSIVMIYFTVITLPTIFLVFSLHVRRLHDQDISGWAVLLGFIPMINLIILYLLFFKKGTPGPNKYGDVISSQFIDAMLNIKK